MNEFDSILNMLATQASDTKIVSELAEPVQENKVAKSFEHPFSVERVGGEKGKELQPLFKMSGDA